MNPEDLSPEELAAVKVHLDTMPGVIKDAMPLEVRRALEGDGGVIEKLAAVKAATDCLDVFCAVSELMAARSGGEGVDSVNVGKSIDALQSQFDPIFVVPWLVMRTGAWIRMLAEGTGRTVDEIVRGRLATTHHDDETDMGMFDQILAVAETGVLPDESTRE